MESQILKTQEENLFFKEGSKAVVVSISGCADEGKDFMVEHATLKYLMVTLCALVEITWKSFICKL